MLLSPTMMMKQRSRLFVWVALVLLPSIVGAQDAASAAKPADAHWSVYRGNAQHTGFVDTALELSSTPIWVHKMRQKPSPAFYVLKREETLAKQSFFEQPLSTDFAFAPVIARYEESKDQFENVWRLIFGSSSEDMIVCLDLVTGKVLWEFFTEGAVRYAPTVYENKVIFGCDDGRVYAVDLKTGKQVWRFDVNKETRWTVINQKVGSQWPVRTNIEVREGKLFFGAGIFPTLEFGTRIFCLDPKEGKEVWNRSTNMASNGYILSAEGNLFVPNGRACPTEYAPKDGLLLYGDKTPRRQGGGVRIGMFDEVVFYGPTEFGIIQFRPSRKIPEGGNWQRDYALQGVLTGVTGVDIASDKEQVYFLKEDQLVAISKGLFASILKERADAHAVAKGFNKDLFMLSQVQSKSDITVETPMIEKAAWKATVASARSVVVAGNTVVVGCKDKVVAFDKKSGAPVMNVSIKGRVWEMAVGNGILVVNTEEGYTYAFGKTDKPTVDTSPVLKESFVANATVTSYAEEAVKRARRDKGFFVVAGLKDGQLTAEIIKKTQMRAICLTNDSAVAETVRRHLLSLGIYDKANVFTIKDANLPFAPYIANLVVSEIEIPLFAPAEILRITQPYGGMVLLPNSAKNWGSAEVPLTVEGAFASFKRGELKGGGEWTHMYADAANTSCSEDEFVKGDNYFIQWVGGTVSHDFNAGLEGEYMAPLFKDGILYVIKQLGIQGVDAYNGTELWKVPLKDYFRFTPLREGGSACVADGKLYLVIKNQCVVFDGETGKEVTRINAPDKAPAWGFIALQYDKLYGTAQVVDATHRYLQRDRDLKKSAWLMSEVEFVVADKVFALERVSGKPAWSYGDGKRRIINSTITLDGKGRMYFVETRADNIVKDADGSVLLRDVFKTADAVPNVVPKQLQMDEKTLKKMCTGKFPEGIIPPEAFTTMKREEYPTWLITLDAHTGAVIKEEPFRSKARSAMYLSYRNDKLLLFASNHSGPLEDEVPFKNELDKKADEIKKTLVNFIFSAFKAEDYEKLFETTYTPTTKSKFNQIVAHHNYNVLHPAYLDDAIWYSPGFRRPSRVDMETGAIEESVRKDESAKGCSPPTASKSSMFYRSFGVSCYTFDSRKRVDISTVTRTGCWINILPAGGIVMVPEYSVGCSCAYPYQTSIAFYPGEPKKEKANPKKEKANPKK